MGYLLATEAVDFFVPALHAEPALNVMFALNLVGTEKLGSTYVEALSRALTNLGYHVTATEDGVRIHSFHDLAHPSIEFAVLALASFVAEGSELWRDVTDDQPPSWQLWKKWLIAPEPGPRPNTRCTA